MNPPFVSFIFEKSTRQLSCRYFTSTIFDEIHKLASNLVFCAIVLLFLFLVVLPCHLIEFPFLQLCFCFDPVYFLAVVSTVFQVDVRELRSVLSVRESAPEMLAAAGSVRAG